MTPKRAETEAGLIRINEEDISKSLDVVEEIFSQVGPENFVYLQQFHLLDTSEDPDFQGDPINNMTNTNLDRGARVGDWAGILVRLGRVTTRLAACPALTQLVLPFVSDQATDTNISLRMKVFGAEH